jgi:ABC-2 type transport system ATP-binding protein
MMSAAMLRAAHLRKSFGSIVAVDDVSFGVEGGELIGLLGPNGAGKTTTVSMIAGLLTPDAGEVLVGGRRLSGDTDPLKRRIGLVPQDLALYDELSARANLRFFGSLYNLTGAALDRAVATTLEKRRSGCRLIWWDCRIARGTASRRSAAA